MICDSLSQLLVKSDHLSVPVLIEVDIPGGSAQLVLDPGVHWPHCTLAFSYFAIWCFSERTVVPHASSEVWFKASVSSKVESPLSSLPLRWQNGSSDQSLLRMQLGAPGFGNSPKAFFKGDLITP